MVWDRCGRNVLRVINQRVPENFARTPVPVLRDCPPKRLKGRSVEIPVNEAVVGIRVTGPITRQTISIRCPAGMYSDADRVTGNQMCWYLPARDGHGCHNTHSHLPISLCIL